MPVNYQQIQSQTNRFCKRAVDHLQSAQSTADQLHKILNRLDDQKDELIRQIDIEAQTNNSLRCARPFLELPTNIHPLPDKSEAVILIAADGSQINPSRHRQIDFGMINISTICLQTELGSAPTIETESELLDDYGILPTDIRLTEDYIALERDLRERAALLHRARQYPATVFTLTDGPLEIFRETRSSVQYTDKLREYLKVLTACQEAGIVPAGYVDKPRSDLVNRMIRLAIDKLPSVARSVGVKLEPIWIPDAYLFSKILLSPGDRSAIFGIQSPLSRNYSKGIDLCFFYVNVSHSGKPWLARVELPAWVAESPPLLDKLHAAIFSQCEIMGTRPYPYILHRAHEIANISYEETNQIENMLAVELYEHGLEIGKQSNKQSAKELPGKGRYQ